MIWADRIALVWGLLAAAFLYLALPNLNGTAQIGPDYPPFLAIVIVVGVPWLLMRGLDFIVTGQIRGSSSASR